MSVKLYHIKEIYLTIQGEGAQTGRVGVFVRFSGCNLWSGREEDRASAMCNFCDTEFRGTDGVGGGKFTAEQLVAEVLERWTGRQDKPFVIFTGGEPMLQVDLDLIIAMHKAQIQIAIETNGTLPVPREIDWICVSPKAGTEIVQRSGDELKIVYPQTGIDPEDLADWDFNVFSIQPMDGDSRNENTRAAAAYCLNHPHWKLSLQTHKFIGIP